MDMDSPMDARVREVVALAEEALDLAKKAYGWAVHDPNTKRLNEEIGRLRAGLVKHGGQRPLG